jgi:hypothetical protein
MRHHNLETHTGTGRGSLLSGGALVRGMAGSRSVQLVSLPTVRRRVVDSQTMRIS